MQKPAAKNPKTARSDDCKDTSAEQPDFSGGNQISTKLIEGTSGGSQDTKNPKTKQKEENYDDKETPMTGGSGTSNSWGENELQLLFGRKTRCACGMKLSSNTEIISHKKECNLCIFQVQS